MSTLTEPKFVVSFTKNHLEKYFAQLEKCGNTFPSLVLAVGCFGPSCFGPESFKFVDLFGLIGDVANNNEFQGSFFCLFERQKRAQFRVSM